MWLSICKPLSPVSIESLAGILTVAAVLILYRYHNGSESMREFLVHSTPPSSYFYILSTSSSLMLSEPWSRV